MPFWIHLNCNRPPIRVSSDLPPPSFPEFAGEKAAFHTENVDRPLSLCQVVLQIGGTAVAGKVRQVNAVPFRQYHYPHLKIL